MRLAGCLLGGLLKFDHLRDNEVARVYFVLARQHGSASNVTIAQPISDAAMFFKRRIEAFAI